MSVCYSADIVTTTDNLYRGRISEHFIDTDGKLTGLILTEAKRFDQRTYLRDCDSKNQRESEEYWREIPGAKLYMFADKIVNLNMNYESPEPTAEVLAKFLSERLKRPVRIDLNPRRKKGT